MIIPKEQIMWEVFCKFKQGYKLLDYKKRWQQQNGGEMTDKEIIIDGVDVSRCVFFDKHNGKNLCCCDDTRDDKLPFLNFCIENKDCYFKQFKRKEQECEKQKQRLDEIEKILDNATAEAQTNNAKWLQAHYLARFCEIRDIINKTKVGE